MCCYTIYGIKGIGGLERFDYHVAGSERDRRPLQGRHLREPRL